MSGSRDVVVVGSGGLGREIAEAVSHASALGLRLVGVLDDDPGSTAPVPHLGPVAAENVPAGAAVIIGVGDTEARARLVRRLGGSVAYESVVHPTAYVSPSAELGIGTYVAPFAYVGTGAKVGDHAVLNIHSSAGHDSHIGTYAVLSPYATLNGHSRVGAGALLGTSAAVAIGVHVGSWSRVAAGTIVTEPCESGSLVVGSPARSRVLFRPPDEA